MLKIGHIASGRGARRESALHVAVSWLASGAVKMPKRHPTPSRRTGREGVRHARRGLRWPKPWLLMIVLVLSAAIDSHSFRRSISEVRMISVDEAEKTSLNRKPTKLANRTKVV